MEIRPEMKVMAERILAVLLGSMFVYAGVIKALDPSVFAKQVSNFQLVNRPIAAGIALFLPWLEIVCGLTLVLHWASRGALVISCLLSGMFCCVLVSALARGLDVTCGCFGAGTGTSLAWSLARAAGLTLIGVSLVLAQRAYDRGGNSRANV